MAGIVKSHRYLERGFGELRGEVKKVGEAVAELSNAEGIAAAVTAAVRADRRRSLSIGQKAAGAILAVFLAVPTASQIVGWWTG